MKDRIQKLANQFCAEFGFRPIRIPFAEAFTKADLNLYNWLLMPQAVTTPVERRREKKMIKLMDKFTGQERAAALKDYLWRNVVNATGVKGFVSEIEARDVRILRAAIDMCEKSKVTIKLDRESYDYAKDIANKIRRFHVRGKAIKEFKDLLRLVTAERGKMPLVEAKPSDLEYYLHEAIHYVLRGNGLWTPIDNPFNEGICTFFHMRWRGKFRTYGMYHWPMGRSNYRRWSKFFFELFKNTPNRAIGPYLRRNFKIYLREFNRRFG